MLNVAIKNHQSTGHLNRQDTFDLAIHGYSRTPYVKEYLLVGIM